MDKLKALELQKKMGISIDLLCREEYEMIILKSLFESDMGKVFVFKGGTALRLAYGSSRFSEDLDFNLVSSIDAIDIEKLKNKLTDISENFKEMRLSEFVVNKNTILAVFKITLGYLSFPFSIKFEVSTRENNWVKNEDYILTLLRSEVVNLTVLAQVATLERIKKDKESINPLRVRDVFDIWYIDQKLGINSNIDFINIHFYF